MADSIRRTVALQILAARHGIRLDRRNRSKRSRSNARIIARAINDVVASIPHAYALDESEGLMMERVKAHLETLPKHANP